MFDPTFETKRLVKPRKGNTRKGAVMPLFAFVFPVLLILCGFAINLAYMQMVSTELKIATDAAAHAAGRAMSIHQTTDAAIAQAELTAQANLVGGKVIEVSTDDRENDNLFVEFGVSTRGDNGYGMYQFDPVPKSQVDNGSERATSVAVSSRVTLPLVFQVMNFEAYGGHMTEFNAARRSIATQIDRDIGLVLDRSGSMLYFRDDEDLTDTLYDLYSTKDTITHYKWEYEYWKFRWRQRSNGSWYRQWQEDMGYHDPDDQESNWYRRYPDNKREVVDYTEERRRISWDEYQWANRSLYSRYYTDNVVYQLERWDDEFHSLGDSFSSSERMSLNSEMARYTADWEYNSNTAPRHSRWYYLDLGVTAFLDILEITDQEELVSLVTFSSSARVDHALLEVYDPVRSTVSSIDPNGGTAIGDGMLEALPPIVDGDAARPFAAKTIVVLTDGDNNPGTTDPQDAVAEIIGDHNVTIHTVTFSEGANQQLMKDVAEAGYGRHYHANDGDVLIEIFEEIANNLPTILTE